MNGYIRVGLLLQLAALTCSIAGAADDHQDVDYKGLLTRLWAYKTELPQSLLDQAAGLQGNTERLERALLRMMRGEKTRVALMGGSISIRGWHYPDQSYMAQVHKWLETVFVPGCREAVAAARDGSTAADDGGAGKGGEADDAEEEEGEQHRHQMLSGARVRVQTRDSQTQGRGTGRGLSHAGLNTQGEGAAGQHSGGEQSLGETIAGAGSQAEGVRRLLRDKGDPRPDPEQDLHVTTNKEYLKSGHLCQGSHIIFSSLAVPAAGPGYAERCMLHRMPQDVDLVVLDFGVNDYQRGSMLSHPERHAYERIMRTILALPNRPALLLFSAYSWEQAHGTFSGLFPEAENVPGIMAQDKHQAIAEYYGDVQALSARAALHQVLEQSDDVKYRVIFLGKMRDLLHVNLLGHRWYADIIITYLRGVTTELAARQLAATALQKQGAEAAASQLLLGIPVDNTGDAADGALQWANPCGSVHGARGVDFATQCAGNGLKPPFFPGNEVQELGVCAVGEDFEGVVTSHEGWAWIDEGSGGVHKWGYVSSEVGAKLTIGVKMAERSIKDTATGKPAKPVNKMITHLIYLQSYTGMGTAKVSCGGGCSCEGGVVDGMAKNENILASIPALYEFEIKRVDGADAAACQVTVEILEKSTRPSKAAILRANSTPPRNNKPAPIMGPGHKFKVIGITSSEQKVWHMEEILSRGDDEAAGR